MARAWEQLHDYGAGARSPEALTRAAEELHRRVARLAAVHERPEWLAAQESGRAQIG